MASVMASLPESVKADIDHFSWVNWSEVAREAFIKKLKRLETMGKIEKLLEKSEFTEKDADELADKVKISMHKRLKREGLT